MAKISANGTELFRYLKGGRLYSIRSNGVTLARTAYHRTWFVAARKKPEVPMADWVAAKRKRYEAVPVWARDVKSIPSINRLERMVSDCLAETVTGYQVEPDGHGPDGSPSWLLALGLM
jgi:hypothetical protein